MCFPKKMTKPRLRISDKDLYICSTTTSFNTIKGTIISMEEYLDFQHLPEISQCYRNPKHHHDYHRGQKAWVVQFTCLHILASMKENSPCCGVDYRLYANHYIEIGWMCVNRVCARFGWLLPGKLVKLYGV